MKSFFLFLIFLILTFQTHAAKAQTCKAFYQPLDSVSAWTELIMDAGKQKGAIPIDLAGNRQIDSASFGKLQKLLQKLSTHPEDINSKSIDRTADQLAALLYEVANQSADEKLGVSNLGSNSSRMKALHKGIFLQIMKSDLLLELQDYSAESKPPNRFLKPFVITKEKLQGFLKRNSLKIRAGIWTSIHAPLLYFGHFYPLYLIRNGNIKIRTETIDLARKAIKNGDYNSALLLIKSHLDQTYMNPHIRNQIYGAIQGTYNTISALVLAHFIMTSGLVQHYTPAVSQTYNEVVVPVVDVVDARVVTPFVNSVQRLYTNREQFEGLVIEKAIQQKEEVLGHKIPLGSPEYLETANHVQSLELDVLEQFYASMK